MENGKLSWRDVGDERGKHWSERAKKKTVETVKGF
jgi:hypothetical protein